MKPLHWATSSKASPAKPSRAYLLVDLQRLLRDLRPGELRDAALPPRSPIALRTLRVGDQCVDRLGDPGLVTDPVVGVVVHQRTGHPVIDHLGYAANLGRHHRGAA